MKHTRVIVTRYGGPDAITVVQEERPEPKPDEVRVRVLAAGVSLPDIMMREGIHPEKPVPPFTPGWDLVGIVDRVGTQVSGIQAGEVVMALPMTGAYAEYVCLPSEEVFRVPRGLDPAETVSLGLNYVTAYQTAKGASPERVRTDFADSPSSVCMWQPAGCCRDEGEWCRTAFSG